MKFMGKRWTMMLTAVLAAVLGLVAPALADTLHLKDGRVLTGEIEREGEGFVHFTIVTGAIRVTELFATADIVKIERSEKDAAKEDQSKDESQPAAPSDGAVRVTFVEIADMVGPLLNADAIRASVELAKPEKPDVLVLLIDSGGGALAEVEDLSDLIHKEFKKEFRTVGWIRSAISAASLTIFNCEEIYMMREGNVGGTVAYVQGSGGNKALDGVNLEQVLSLGEMISKRGKRDPIIMRAMQVWTTLTADIDEFGRVTWYPNDKGKFKISTTDRILTFNSQDALKFGVSKGTADTKDELMKAMGISEWVEVGKKANEHQRAFRESVKTVQARMSEIGARYEMEVQAATGASNQKDRGLHVGRARNLLNELRSLVRRAPSVEKYMGLTPEVFQEREEQLRKLLQNGRS